jgi:hypothetical protein
VNNYSLLMNVNKPLGDFVGALYTEDARFEATIKIKALA